MCDVWVVYPRACNENWARVQYYCKMPKGDLITYEYAILHDKTQLQLLLVRTKVKIFPHR